MRLVVLALAAGLAPPPASRAEGQVEPGDARDQGTRSGYTAEQVRSAVEEHVHRTMRASGGTYPIADERAGKTVALELIQVTVVSAGSLWKVHDPDRRVDGRSFMACTLFHPVGTPQEKLYDVDMLVEPRDGRLAVTDVRIHKEKQLVRGQWIWQARPAAGKPR